MAITSITFRPNGNYTVTGPSDGLTITVPPGHDTGITPSYQVVLPTSANGVVVACYGGGGSAVLGDDSGYIGMAGQKVQSAALTGILGVQLDLFVGAGAYSTKGYEQAYPWPDGAYANSGTCPGAVGCSSSVYLHSGTVLKMLAGGGDDAYGDNSGPNTHGPYNSNTLGDYGGTVTNYGAANAGDSSHAGADGWITITYDLSGAWDVSSFESGWDGWVTSASDATVTRETAGGYYSPPPNGIAYVYFHISGDGVASINKTLHTAAGTMTFYALGTLEIYINDILAQSVDAVPQAGWQPYAVAIPAGLTTKIEFRAPNASWYEAGVDYIQIPVPSSTSVNAITFSGGAVSGGLARVAVLAALAVAVGAIAGGSASGKSLCVRSSLGGAVAGGSAGDSSLGEVSTSGGAVVSGSADVTVLYVQTLSFWPIGGGVVSGVAPRVVRCFMSSGSGAIAGWGGSVVMICAPESAGGAITGGGGRTIVVSSPKPLGGAVAWWGVNTIKMSTPVSAGGAIGGGRVTSASLDGLATGGIGDIQARLLAALPPWFGDHDSHPVLDTLLWGAAAVLSPVYSLVAYVRAQMRRLTASDGNLDLISADFFGALLPRRAGEADAAYNVRIGKELLRPRVTPAAVKQAVRDVAGDNPVVYETMTLPKCVAYNRGAYGVNRYGAVRPIAFLEISNPNNADMLDIRHAVNAVRPVGNPVWIVVPIPADALLDELGMPILDEFGKYIRIEGA